MPLFSDEPQIDMYSMTTNEPCNCGRIKITKEGFTGLKNVYRMTINLTESGNPYEDGYYFVLRQLSQDEIDKQKMQGDIEYLAMMTNTDMEEV